MVERPIRGIQRKHYKIEARYCPGAVQAFLDAREAARIAKREIWMDRYGADGGTTGGSPASLGLLYQDTASGREAMYALAGKGGFRKPKRGGGAWWELYPNRATVAGKIVQGDLERVDKAIGDRKDSLVRAIGIEGAQYHNGAFHHHLAHPLPDGSVAVSLAVAPNGRLPTAIQAHAQLITEGEYRDLLSTSARYQEGLP